MDIERISFSTGALYPMESYDALRMLSSCGYRHAELMPQCFSDIDCRNYNGMKSTGIHIASIHYPLAMFALLYSAHEGMSREGMEFADKLIAFAKNMGSEVIVIHPVAEMEGEMSFLQDRIHRNIRYIGNLCQEEGLILAMENHPSGKGQYPELLDAYVDSLGIASMRPMVDTTESWEGGVDPVDFIFKLRNAPCHLHLSDFADGCKHYPIGTGKTDWESLVTLLKDRNYSGYWTLEPAYRHYLSNIENKLIESRKYLEELL